MNDLRDYRPMSSESRSILGLSLRWGVFLAVAIVAIIIVAGPIGLALGWYSTGLQVISPQNVTAQFHDAYTRYESLKATACNVKGITTEANSAQGDSNVYYQLESQVQAYTQNYNRISAEYNAAYDNAFEAAHVGPRNLPRPAPPLGELEQACP